VVNGFGRAISDAQKAFWLNEVRESYRGDEGRTRARFAAINLPDRDGLLGRISDVHCPVLWMHGTQDEVYSVANAKVELELFTGMIEKELMVVESGSHFLSATHPAEVDEKVVEFIRRYTQSVKGGEVVKVRLVRLETYYHMRICRHASWCFASLMIQ
jgi:pimeloyl-ACP methyl ester carboxylesterase